MREGGGAGAGGGSGGETECGIISLTRRTRAVKTALLLTTRRENRCVSLRAASAVFGLDARHEWVSARSREKKKKKKVLALNQAVFTRGGISSNNCGSLPLKDGGGRFLGDRCERRSLKSLHLIRGL